MEVILFLLLGGAVAYLWQRVDRLETNLREWQRWAAESLHHGAAAEPFEQAVPREEADSVERIEPDVSAPPGPAAIPAARASEPAQQEAVVPATTAFPSDEERGAPLAEQREDREDAATSEYRSPRFRLSFDFEEIFGRLLPIWAGGIALAVGGFFLVRWSIEAGLLTPSVRVLLGFLFGLGLVGAAEIAFRFDKWIADERVRQALAGAGLATLYASFYLAGSHYDLIGATFAFLGLATVTAAAIALSFRFGLPSAILGLVGGFAAPLLVGSDEANVPLLALYLGLVTAGLTWTGRQQHRSWLALAALAGGLGWGVLLFLSEATGTADLVAYGGYLVLLGAVLPAFSDKTDGPLWIRIGAAAIASLQLAAMVAQAGYTPLVWGLYLLIGAALAFFGWREPRMREANAVAAAIGLGLVSLWPDPSVGEFAWVMVAMTVVFALVPLALVWRDRARLVDVFQIGGFALAASAVTWLHFALEDVEPLVALAVLGFAMLPAMAAWLRWPGRDEDLPLGVLVSVAVAATALFGAGLTATPDWAAPLVGAAVAAGLLLLSKGREGREFLTMAWVAALAGLFGLLTWIDAWKEGAALFGGGAESDYLLAPLRWAATTAIFAWLALRDDLIHARRIAEAIAAASLYALAAQVLPGDALAWFAGLAATVLGWTLRNRRAGQTVLFGIAAIWAAPVVLPWLAEGLDALAGEPMLASGAGILRDVALYAMPVIAYAAVTLVRSDTDCVRWRAIIATIGGIAALSAAHLAFKQVFAVDGEQAFAAYGVIERIAWQVLLLGAAAAVWRFARSQSWAVPTMAALVATALLHFALFSLGWHNPLWAEQHVGALPLANWLVPAYATGIAGLVAVRSWLAGHQPHLRPLADTALMVVIAFLALSELRQVFAGSVLISTPVEQVEDVLRSVLGIMLAIGFLLWGAWRNERSWRIGSLVLMLVAVAKVFLFDAAGLEDLARIASFMALGFSLIGIGWFYSRQLRPKPVAEA